MGKPVVDVVTQIGVETTKGTAVPANRKLTELVVTMGPKFNNKFFRASGYKINTDGVKHREWAEGKFEGPLSFNSIVYILEGLIGSAGPTALASPAQEWDYAPLSSGPDSNSKTFTIQEGDAEGAQQVTFGQFNTLQIDNGADDLKISGNLLSRAIDNTVSLTASPTEIVQMPAASNQIDVFLDSSAANLGTTRLTDISSETINVGDKLKPKFVHNTAFQSFKELIEAAYDLKFSFDIENNAQARALYNSANTSSLPEQFIRIAITGPLITGSVFHLIQIDICGRLETADPIKDADGVYAYKFSFTATHDTVWGAAWKIKVINKLASL